MAEETEVIDIKGLDVQADLVATGKLLHSGKDQLVVCTDANVRAYKIEGDSAHLLFSVDLKNAVRQLAIVDVNADGQSEILAATGSAGYSDNIDINLFVIENSSKGWKPRHLFNKKSERPTPTFLAFADLDGDLEKEIILSYFESKYIVETVSIRDNGTASPVTRLIERNRMAIARDVGILPNKSMIGMLVGRPYGDEVGYEGDAYILEQGEKLVLPSFRGVKAVKIGDIEGDGQNEIFFGDGWHQDYGKVARGRIAMVSATEKGFRYELIEDVKGQYETRQIDLCDVDQDGTREVLVQGNKYFRIYKKGPDGWRVFALESSTAAAFAVGEISGDGFPEVIFAGKGKIAVFNFKSVKYISDLGQEKITQITDPQLLIGKTAPELLLSWWYGGKPTTLDEQKGKVVVLDYWATWCKPCIKMFPVLREWQEKYGRSGLVILGLTRLDDSQNLQKIASFVQENGFPYRIGVAEDADNHLAYGVNGIPHMVLIDKKGVVRRFEKGAGSAAEFEAAIQKYLQE